MARLFESNCEFGLFKIMVHLLNHLCDDLEKIWSLRFYILPPLNLIAAFKLTYTRTCMRRATRMPKMASGLK